MELEDSAQRYDLDDSQPGSKLAFSLLLGTEFEECHHHYFLHPSQPSNFFSRLFRSITLFQDQNVYILSDQKQQVLGYIKIGPKNIFLVVIIDLLLS
jgi:hypothetical protein